jgi:hypothetical protein
MFKTFAEMQMLSAELAAKTFDPAKVPFVAQIDEETLIF